MRTLQLKSRTNLDWSGKFVDQSNYDQLLGDESVKVLKPDGSILLVYLKRALDPGKLKLAWNGVLKNYHTHTNNRAIAAGVQAKYPTKKDGTISRTATIEQTIDSGVIGYMDRNPRFPYCRASAFNLKYPDLFAKLLPTLQETCSLFAQELPESFNYQRSIAEVTSPDFLIPGTIYTTLTVNKNFRTACHKDAGDLPLGRSSMILIREGQYTGGHLVLPDFRVGVKLDTTDLIIFDPHEFHGNTPIKAVSKEYQRCTVVCYYRENMQFCGTADDERELAKHRNVGEELITRNLNPYRRTIE